MTRNAAVLLALTLLPVTAANALIGAERADDNYGWLGYVTPPGASLPLKERGCMASLVASNWVLTSAKCVLNYDTRSREVQSSARLNNAGKLAVKLSDLDFEILLGSANLRSEQIERHSAAQIVLHPGFTVPADGGLTHFPDAALIRLSRHSAQTPVPVSGDALAGFTPRAGQAGRVLSWGSVRYPDSLFGNPAYNPAFREYKLTQGDVTVAGSCDLNYGAAGIVAGVCVNAATTRELVSCFGDAGAPLVVMNPGSGQYTLSGVIAHSRSCSNQSPMRFVSTEAVSDWIEAVVKGKALDSLTVDGNVGVTCSENACDFDGSNLSVGGDKPVSIQWALRKRGAALEYSAPGIRYASDIEIGGDYLITALVRHHNGEFASKTVSLNAVATQIDPEAKMTGNLSITCQATVCVFDATALRFDSYGVENGLWRTPEDVRVGNRVLMDINRSQYVVRFEGTGPAGQAVSIRALVRTYEDEARVEILYNGELEKKETEFTPDEMGIEVTPGWIVGRLRADTADLRLFLQLYVPGKGWSVVDRLDVKAGKIGRYRKLVGETGLYRFKVRAMSGASKYTFYHRMR